MAYLVLVLPWLGCGPAPESSVSASALATLELDWAFQEPFSHLRGVRELSDGRLLAADPLSEVVVRIDPASGSADTLGGHGEGPMEYGQPDQVFPLPGDSTLVVDLGNSRLAVLDPGGTPVEWIPMYRATEDGNPTSLHPQSVDAGGSLYTYGPSGREDTPPDSGTVVRFDRQEESYSEVARYWRPPFRRPPSGRRPMLLPADDWAIGGDGRLAVIHANGYSVDWLLPGGTAVVGPPHEGEIFPVGEAEKLAELEFMGANAIVSTILVGPEGTQSRTTRRGIPQSSFPGLDEFDWPEMLPIFRAGGTLVSPLGEAWVERMMPSDRAPRVDVFDGDGIRSGYIELPPGARVIGFSRGSGGQEQAYLARTDEMGLVWLERYDIHRGER